jgi:flavin-dependent dehydrogenase
VEQLLTTEVCVVGGGPAGATLARSLALLGHEVCLVERADFPRSHVGESLPSSILSLLDVLGVRERVEAASFLRPDRAIVRWAAATDHLKSQPGEPGFQVDRGPFDRILLEAAANAGVQILQPAAARPPYQNASGQWQIPVRRSREALTIRAAFLADASGRRRWLPGTVSRCSAPTLALYGYWRDAEIEGVETRVEAASEGWFWGAPLPDGTFNATVFLDPDRCAAAGRRELERFYRSLLAGSTLLGGCLHGRLCGGVVACSASCYADPEPVTQSWIRVGEAAFSIDPLSSQGVQTAIGSGLQACRVVHTLLTAPEHAGAAMEFYRSRQAEIVAQHQSLAAAYYAEPKEWGDRPFWRRRATTPAAQVPPARSDFPSSRVSAGTRVALSRDAVLVETPCVVDSVISARRALCHPRLQRPVAFLEGIELAPLLDGISPGETLGEMIRHWERRIPFSVCVAIARWMYSTGILVPAETG